MSTLAAPPSAVAASHRQVLGGAGVLLLTTACGRAPAPGATTPGDGNFPRTIEHKHGSTEIPARPERIVTVGLSDHDPLLAMGLAPVGVAEWYGDYRFATWPWARDELGGDPEDRGGQHGAQLRGDRRVATRPDHRCILGFDRRSVPDAVTNRPYRCPVRRFPDYGTPWQEMTRVIGRSVSRAERAEQLVTAVEDRFATARQQHPQFSGRTAAFVLPAEDGSYHAYASEDTRARFLTSFGFTVPARIDELAGGTFYADISAERLSIVDDADALVWDAVNSPPEWSTDIKDDPLYQRLTAAKQGRDVFVEDKVTLGAIAWSTVLSLPFAIDRLVPRLAAAVDRDPATRTEPGA